MTRLWILIVFCSMAMASQVRQSAPQGKLVNKRQAMPSRVWPGARIPLGYAPGYPDNRKASIQLGIAMWERNTCVRFVNRTAVDADWAQVIDGASCQSSVGKQGTGRQTIVLGPDCDGIGSTSHELAHTIGLQHMQTRPDRDQYITIMRARLAPGMYALNYEIEAASSSMGLPYDYTSLLHYGPYEMASYAYRGQATIIPKDPAYKDIMGNYYPSFYDISRVNLLYNCTAACEESATVCANNGEVDVNNCARCRCAPGWGGQDCSADPDGAIILTASDVNQTFTTTLGQMSDEKAIDYKFKHVVIKAPAGRSIQLTIPYMWASYDQLCKYGGLEVFTKNDTRIGPPRVCAMTLVQPSYTSEGSRLYIRLFNRIYQLSMTITYIAV